MTTNKISLQDIFTKAWNHFVLGNGKACIGEIGCKYRMKTKDGETRCAVGLALSSEQIDEIESSKEINFGLTTFYSLTRMRPQWFDESVLSKTYAELNDFQRRLHDSLALFMNDKERVRIAYLLTAEEFELTIP